MERTSNSRSSSGKRHTKKSIKHSSCSILRHRRLLCRVFSEECPGRGHCIRRYKELLRRLFSSEFLPREDTRRENLPDNHTRKGRCHCKGGRARDVMSSKHCSCSPSSLMPSSTTMLPPEPRSPNMTRPLSSTQHQNESNDRVKDSSAKHNLTRENLSPLLIRAEGRKRTVQKLTQNAQSFIH